jgi:hypothetical protein
MRLAQILLGLMACFSSSAAAGQLTEEAIGSQITDEALVTKKFYTGNLGWYFQPTGTSLTMTGYTS